MLDPDHTTTSLSANQMIRVHLSGGNGCCVGILWILGGFIVACGVGNLVGRRESGRSPFPGLVGSTVAESFASQVKYLLPSVSSFASVDTFWPGASKGSLIAKMTQGTQSMGGVLVESGEEDVPLAVLLRQLKTKSSKQVNAFKLSDECRPDPIPPTRQDGDAWVFTGEMFRRVPFENVFDTGPEDPLENCLKFYCLMCKFQVSKNSRSLSEIKRHCQSVRRLRQEKRYRHRYFPGAVRGKDERHVYMKCEVTETDHKKLFNYDVVERKTFVFTSGHERVRIQLQLLTTFLKNGGQLWMLDELQTQVGILTWNSVHFGFRLQPRPYQCKLFRFACIFVY